MSRDAFTALPLRPCNTAALADSGVPILVEQGRCDGFSWMRTTSAGALFYSALVEHGNKGGFGSLSTCRWLLFGAGAVPDGQAAGRAERGHGWVHALFGNARPHKLASAMWVEDLSGESSGAAYELAGAAAAAWPACAGAQLVPTQAGRRVVQLAVLACAASRDSPGRPARARKKAKGEHQGAPGR